LVRALDLAVQRAGGGEQVLDARRGARLLEAPGALVAHEHQGALALRLVRQRLEMGARLGREIRGHLAAQHGRKLFSDRHEAYEASPGCAKGGASCRTGGARGKWR